MTRVDSTMSCSRTVYIAKDNPCLVIDSKHSRDRRNVLKRRMIEATQSCDSDTWIWENLDLFSLWTWVTTEALGNHRD